MKPQCKIQWLDANDAPTPDTNDAIGYAYMEAYTAQPSQTLPYGFRLEPKTSGGREMRVHCLKCGKTETAKINPDGFMALAYLLFDDPRVKREITVEQCHECAEEEVEA